MSACSLCTPCGKATVLPVAMILTSLQSVSYKPSLSRAVRQRERACRSPTRKGQILAGSRTPGKKFQDHLKSLTRRPFCFSSEEILELLLRPFADPKPRNSHRPQSHA